MTRNLTQRGIALPLTLLLLFIMTLIGVASLRSTVFEEGMTGNARLRQIAFNAAESALREAENRMIKVSKNQAVADARSLFFDGLRPDGFAQPGDTCTNGYCIPLKHNSTATTNVKERWEDPALDVWNTTGKHIEYGNYGDSDFADEGVFAAPKYIIEFMGHVTERQQGRFQTNCDSDEPTGRALAPNDVWPYCASDPAVYRITVRAAAGPKSRQAQVTLQSTIKIP